MNNLWLWAFEFRLNRVKDDKKIEFITRKLLKELEGQGYHIDDMLPIWTYGNHLRVGVGVDAGNDIDCGKYIKKELSV